MQVQPRFDGLLIDTRYAAASGNPAAGQSTRATLVPTNFPGLRQDEVRIRKTFMEPGSGAKVVENYRFMDNQIGEATRMLDTDAILRQPINPDDESDVAEALRNLSALKLMLPELIASVVNNIAPGEIETKISRTTPDGDTQTLDLNGVSIADIEHGVRSYVPVFMNAENNSTDLTLTTEPEEAAAKENAPPTWEQHYRRDREVKRASLAGREYTGTAVVLNTTHDELKPL